MTLRCNCWMLWIWAVTIECCDFALWLLNAVILQCHCWILWLCTLIAECCDFAPWLLNAVTLRCDLTCSPSTVSLCHTCYTWRCIPSARIAYLIPFFLNKHLQLCRKSQITVSHKEATVSDICTASFPPKHIQGWPHAWLLLHVHSKLSYTNMV